MRKLKIFGSFIFGWALAGFGIIQLATQNFLTALLPFGKLPLHIVWVYLTSLLFLVIGFLCILHRLLRYATLTAAILFSLFFLYPHVPVLFTDPHNPGEWAVAFECLAIASGACMIGFAQQHPTTLFENRIGVVARFVFAICLLVFGVQHFMYADFIESLMPEWMPLKSFWSQVIRYGFALAAISLMLNYQIRFSMFLLGLMFFVWVVVLHAPRSLQKLTVADEWASLSIALALAGIAFSVAGSSGNTSTAFGQKRYFMSRNKKITL